METEIKVEVRDFGALREKLDELGARCEGVVEEQNRYFDRENQLRAKRQSLRLRQDHRARLTWKGPSEYQDGVIARPEVELEVSSFSEMATLLNRLGYQVVQELEKQRETWRLDGVEVALDTLDFGRFVELEGDAARVTTLARQLGLDPTAGLADSYRTLQNKRCAR